MKCLALACCILLPVTSYAQQAPPPMQALASMLQECGAREAGARVGAATLQADVALLKATNEELKKQLKSAQDDAPTGSR
jgi:hypothetical protein